jgi:hypothetical protein
MLHLTAYSVYLQSPIRNLDGTVTSKTGTVVKVVQAVEPWSKYSLEDGTVLRIRQTVVNVVKLDDKNDNDEPVYYIQSQQALSVIPEIKE